MHLVEQRVAQALTPGGIVIALDLIRAFSVAESTQIDSLMDRYFGAGSGSNYGLWIKSATGSVTAGYVRTPLFRCLFFRLAKF